MWLNDDMAEFVTTARAIVDQTGRAIYKRKSAPTMSLCMILPFTSTDAHDKLCSEAAISASENAPMANLTMPLGIVIALACSNMPCFAQTFDFSFDEFRARLDKRIEADGADKIKECRLRQDIFLCTFDDTKFQQGVKAAKELDIVNGNFELAVELSVEVKSWKVSGITVVGDRGDPLNFMNAIGHIIRMIEFFQPDLTSEESEKMIMELGLMRGDSESTIGRIGRPKMILKKYAEITCNNQHSKRSTRFGCVFSPRY